MRCDACGKARQVRQWPFREGLKPLCQSCVKALQREATRRRVKKALDKGKGL